MAIMTYVCKLCLFAVIIFDFDVCTRWLLVALFYRLFFMYFSQFRFFFFEEALPVLPEVF